MKLWTFTPLDSCFFRGAKPFNAGEGGFLDSQFPPTTQTMTGVIRAAIADCHGVDWATLHKGEQKNIADIIGSHAEDAGKLRFQGPYILNHGQRLFPLPLHMLYNEKMEQWGSLQPSKKTLTTDQGELHLPQVSENTVKGSKPLANIWLDEKNFSQVLCGGTPTDFYREKALFQAESRTGIGRDNATRMVEEGLLYFTRHIRLANGVTLAMQIEGGDGVQPAQMLRLGGEGRMANLTIKNTLPSAPARQDIDGTSMIILLTHADFNGNNAPTLPQGVEIISACIGKAVREGGWDYKTNKPKALQSLVPAGSVYFIKGNSVLLASCLGERTVFGYGEIAIGMMQKGDKQ